MSEQHIYIAGPVTGNPSYQEEFVSAYMELDVKGYTPCSFIDDLHLKLLGFSWADMMRLCLSKLEKCSAILMLPGWESSVGARIEKACAHKMGIPVYTDIDHLPSLVEDVADIEPVE